MGIIRKGIRPIIIQLYFMQFYQTQYLFYSPTNGKKDKNEKLLVNLKDNYCKKYVYMKYLIPAIGSSWLPENLIANNTF